MVPWSTVLEPFSECMVAGAVASVSSYIVFRLDVESLENPPCRSYTFSPLFDLHSDFAELTHSVFTLFTSSVGLWQTGYSYI